MPTVHPQTNAVEPKRYEWLLNPGADILTPHDPFLSALNAELFAEETGLEPHSDNYEVVISPLTPLPMPIAFPDSDGNPTRFADLNPAAAANPLFWLPNTLRHPYVYREADGELAMEANEEWQARVGYELTASGLYDADAGGWTDVLATFLSLDVTDPDVQERVRRYLTGGEDNELDGLHDILADTIAGSPQAQEDELWAIELTTNAVDLALANRYVYATVLRQHIASRGVHLEGREMDPKDLALAVTACGAELLKGIEEVVGLADGSTRPASEYLAQLKEDIERGFDPEQSLQHADTALSVVQGAGMERYPVDEAQSQGVVNS